jgi:hypothetical protein
MCSGDVVVPITRCPLAASERANAIPSQPQPSTNTVGGAAPEAVLVEPPEVELVMMLLNYEFILRSTKVRINGETLYSASKIN